MLLQESIHLHLLQSWLEAFLLERSFDLNALTPSCQLCTPAPPRRIAVCCLCDDSGAKVPTMFCCPIHTTNRSSFLRLIQPQRYSLQPQRYSLQPPKKFASLQMMVPTTKPCLPLQYAAVIRSPTVISTHDRHSTG